MQIKKKKIDPVLPVVKGPKTGGSASSKFSDQDLCVLTPVLRTEQTICTTLTTESGISLDV